MSDKIRLEKDYGAEYEPTDSEDDYSEGEKELLQNAFEAKKHPNKTAKNELMAFTDSDEEQPDDDDDEAGGNSDDDDMEQLMHDSDIEGGGDDDDDGIPNSMDWGSKRGNYYSTDFIDPDYGTYTAEQAEMAKQEEEEALAIQKRLAKQMREEDFLIDNSFFQADKDAGKAENEKTLDTTKFKADFSGLSQREKEQLFEKDSPEFAALVSDFKVLMVDVEKLHSPVLKYVNDHKVPMIPALEFTQLYRNLALTYCSNIGFYLLLKAKRINVRNHPITKRLAQLKKLLFQLQDKYDNIIKPQLEALLERIVGGDEFEVLEIKPVAAKKSKKSKLSILDKYDEADESAVGSKNDDTDMDAEDRAHYMLASSDEDAVEDDDEEGDNDDLDENARRGITYEIAKNKGLMPHRKKEARNPRVKHRSKFRKALIRRKGAVRTVRNETKRYGGEISGIKSTVVKSVKFKT